MDKLLKEQNEALDKAGQDLAEMKAVIGSNITNRHEQAGKIINDSLKTIHDARSQARDNDEKFNKMNQMLDENYRNTQKKSMDINKDLKKLYDNIDKNLKYVLDEK